MGEAGTGKVRGVKFSGVLLGQRGLANKRIHVGEILAQTTSWEDGMREECVGVLSHANKAQKCQ